MDSKDFEMPSPKRQKTQSPTMPPLTTGPPQENMNSSNTLGAGSDAQPAQLLEETDMEKVIHPPVKHDDVNIQNTGEDMLDVLMQHVESETASRSTQISTLAESQQTVEEADNVGKPSSSTQDVDMSGADGVVDTGSLGNILNQNDKVDMPIEGPTVSDSLQQPKTAQDHPDFPPGLEAISEQNINHLKTAAEVNNLPATSDTLIADQIPISTAETQLPNDATVPPSEAREWETDSSPYDSDSSSDNSGSDSSDDDDEDEEEYTLLDPYEQARILMAEDGGGGDDDNSDNEGRRNTNRVNPGLRTEHEQPEEILPKPDIKITDAMPIEELGVVQAVVENTVLISAKTSGEYRVLESNSLLCTESRVPIGVVAETLGRVQKPLYTVRFASASDVQDAGVGTKGTKVYYVPDHSTFVFTQPLKAVKGSDASNFFDEEVGDAEQEFSDDEAEAEHKRQMKLKKRGIDPSTAPPSRGGRGGRGQRGRGGREGNSHMHSIPESDMYGTSTVEMNYDDMEEGETEYTPLRRPDTMTQASPHNMNMAGAMSPQQPQHYNNHQHNGNDRGSRGGSRGGRGRGNFNNNRGSRGERGGHNQNQRSRGGGGGSYNNISYNQNNYNPVSSTSMYANQNQTSQPPPQFHQLPPPPPPPAPQLTPSSGPYSQSNNQGYGNNYNYSSNSPSTIPPSPMTPMTPLPGGQFNFNFGAPGQPQYPPNQGQGQWAQYHANQNYQYQQHQMQQQQPGGQYGNADAIAQVQRTLEELRKAGNNGGAGAWNAGR